MIVYHSYVFLLYSTNVCIANVAQPGKLCTQLAITMHPCQLLFSDKIKDSLKGIILCKDNVAAG